MLSNEYAQTIEQKKYKNNFATGSAEVILAENRIYKYALRTIIKLYPDTAAGEIAQAALDEIQVLKST